MRPPDGRPGAVRGPATPSRLTPGVFGDVGTQVGDQLGSRASVKDKAGAQFHPFQPQFLQPGLFALGPRGAGHVGVGGAAPGRKGRVEAGQPIGGATGAGQGVLEPVDVHGVRRQAQRVAGSFRDEDLRRGARWPVGFDGAAQRGDERTQRPHGTHWRLGPEVVHQAIGGDHPAPGGDKPGEDLTVAGPSQVDRGAVVVEGPYGT